MGHFTKEALDKVTGKMTSALDIDAVYYCLHHPKFTGECNCRKPKNGLLLEAASELNLDLSKSYAIGDRLGDIESANNSNCRATFFIGDWRCDLCSVFKQRGTKKPDFIVKNLAEAAKIIIGLGNDGMDKHKSLKVDRK
jgi:D-glycero-D-manno-heptose 1,7-bisphosphate phosphatase